MIPSSSLNIALINPNSNPETTARMVEIAQAEADLGELEITIEGCTGRGTPTMIVDEVGLAAGAAAVQEICAGLANSAKRCDGVIVAAFGDPGFDRAAQWFPGRAVGIGEAALREAGADGRRFAVATTTPGLVGAIERCVAALGLSARLTGIHLTNRDPLDLMRDPTGLEQALAEAIEAAVQRDAADAVIIGGGPLAVAARALRPRFAVDIVEPLPAAVRRMRRLLLPT